MIKTPERPLPARSELALPVHRHVEHLMGLPVSVALRGQHADTETGRRAWVEAIAELRTVDRVFSTYRDDSMISRFNRGELDLEECPPEVSEVLALGSVAEQQSGGAFSIWLPHPGLVRGGPKHLDPSGVVKGWAVERAARWLDGLDDTDFCLSAGGDMVCRVSDPARPAWRVGIENPQDPTRIIATVAVRNGAVATSGTGHRGSHLVDARTGQLPEGVASVTVIGRSLTWADIDATAAFALGKGAADWLRARPVRGGLVVWTDGSRTTVRGMAAPVTLPTTPAEPRSSGTGEGPSAQAEGGE